jgi:HK97 family phage prohead protease
LSPNANFLIKKNLPDLEHRSCLELRAEGSRLVGYAMVWDTRSRDLGGFIEIVRAAAVDASADVVALYSHDPSQVLGRTPATLQLSKDTRGLAFTLDPAQTTAGRDAYELVKRGDVRGASCGFHTTKDAWHQERDVRIRELLAIELVEISLTAFPAYRETDVSVRRNQSSDVVNHSRTSDDNVLSHSRTLSAPDANRWVPDANRCVPQTIPWLRLHARLK